MTKHYQLTAIENVFNNSEGDVPCDSNDNVLCDRSYTLHDRSPRIINKAEWDELDKVHEVAHRLDSAVVREESVGEYPPTVWKVLHGFDEDIAPKEYTTGVYDDGPAIDGWEDFVCFWSAISRATEPFRVISSTERHGWTTVDDMYRNNADPVLVHAYCANSMVDLYMYNVVENSFEPVTPRHVEQSVEEIIL